MMPETMNQSDDLKAIGRKQPGQFEEAVCRLGGQVPELMVIAAAGSGGMNLKRFSDLYPDRFFNTGMSAEQAVHSAARLAAEGWIPVLAVDSAFLRSAFDRLVRDVCLQNLHVVLAVGCTGMNGSDGEIFRGLYDMPFLSLLPNMTVMAPKDRWELEEMLRSAVNEYSGPAALRLPPGETSGKLQEMRTPVVWGKSEVLYDEKGIALLAAGSMVKTAFTVRARLREIGYSCSLINVRFVRPLDEQMLRMTARDHSLIVTMEENVRSGGFGDRVLEYYNDTGTRVEVINVALPDDYTEYGNEKELQTETCIDADSVLERIIAVYIGMVAE